MNPKYQDKLERLLALHQETEIKIKEIERLEGKLSIPSINELRYFGYHVAKAVSLDIAGDEDSEIDAELEKAFRHCQRASTH